jgi:hypothetical protein
MKIGHAIFCIAAVAMAGVTSGVASDPHTSDSTTAAISDITFSIPRDVPFAAFKNVASGEQTLLLRIPARLVHFNFALVEGRPKEYFVITLRAGGHEPGKLSDYNNIISGQAPTTDGHYRIYNGRITNQQLFVSIEHDEPEFFFCDKEWKGFMAGSARLCHVQEEYNRNHHPIVQPSRSIVMRYDFSFDDVPQVTDLEVETKRILGSFIVNNSAHRP